MTEPNGPPTPVGIVDTSASPHAVLRPVPIDAVTLHEGFWEPRLAANRAAGMPSFLRWLERDDQTAPFPAYAEAARTGDDHGVPAALEAMRNCYMGHNRHRLRHSWRAGVLKWVEACALILQQTDDPGLRQQLDTFAAGVVAAHRDRHFLTDYYGDQFEHSYQLGTPGHLIQMAIAHHRTTGDTSLLQCGIEVADAVRAQFEGKGFADHACIEMALVELYRATREAKYLRAARHLLDRWLGQPPAIGPDIGEGDQRHFNRHVVRQTYLCAGGADYLAETGDPAFRAHLEAIWNDMTGAKMHITGQIAVDYWLPERVTPEPFELAVGVFGVLQDHIVRGGELCEAVGNAYWNWRMLAATGDARYADFLERVLYNNFLAHVAANGDLFHYVSPLASDGDFPPRNASGSPEANCCPPNALRMLASIPGLIFGTSADGVWVHLYDNCRLDWHLDDGTPIELTQRTRYPWDGKIAIDVAPARPTTFALHVRIPRWCMDPAVTINGEPAAGDVRPGSYHAVTRQWCRGDVLSIDLPMPVLAMAVDDRAVAFRQKRALMRGPLVYCFEGVDNQAMDVWDVRLPRGRAIEPGAGSSGLYRPSSELGDYGADHDANLMGGITVLRGPTLHDARGPMDVTAIPYHAWANRGAAPMRVWVDGDEGE